MGLFFALLAAFLFGSSNVFVKTGLVEERLDKYNGLFVTVAVNNIINILILPFIILFTNMPPVNWRGVFFFALGGMLTSFLGRFFLFNCIDHIGASRAVTLKITAPFFTVLLGIFILQEQLSQLVLFGIIIILIGATVVSRDTQKLSSSQQNSIAESEPQNFASISLTDYKLQHQNGIIPKDIKFGIVLGILSGLGFGFGNIFRKLGLELFPTPIIGVVIGSFTALICLMVFPLLSKKSKINLNTLSLKNLSWPYITTGVVLSLALYTQFIALSMAPVSVVSSITATEPFWTILLGVVLLKKFEIITIPMLIGASAIIIGTVLIFMY